MEFDEKHFTVWKMKTMATFIAHNLVDVCETPVASKLIEAERRRAEIAKKESISDSTSSISMDEESRGNSDVVAASSSTSMPLGARETQELLSSSKRAYGALITSLGIIQMKLVQHIVIGDAHGVWKVLLDTYERKSMATKVQSIEQLFHMKLFSNEGVNMYIARLAELERKLLEQEEKISSSIMLFVLLRGLSSEYDTLVTLLKMKENLSYDEAVDAIKNEEERMKVSMKHKNKSSFRSGSSNEESAQAVFSNPNSNCFTCHKSGHQMYDCPSNKGVKKCSRCRRLGHELSKCRATYRVKGENDTYAAIALEMKRKEEEEDQESDDEWGA